MMEQPYLNLEGEDLVPYWVVRLVMCLCPELRTSQGSVSASLSLPPATGLPFPPPCPVHFLQCLDEWADS